MVEDERHISLRAILGVCSIVMLFGGIFLVLAGASVIDMLWQAFGIRASLAQSAMTVLILKLFGAMLFTWGIFLYSAYSDPVGNAAIVRGTIVGFVALAAAQVLAILTTDIASEIPLPFLLARPVLCTILAILLFRLRPASEKLKGQA